MTDFRGARTVQTKAAGGSETDNKNVMREGSNRPSLLVYLIIALCAAAIVYGVYYFAEYSVKNDYSIAWQKTSENADGEIDTFRDYAGFCGGIIKYTKDGAEYLDKNGSAVWDRSYEMTSPVIDVSSKYACIADRGATSLYIFDSTALTGVCETLLPISLVRVSDSGIVYAVLNDSDAEYITAFRFDGTAVDLSVKSIFTGDGYPFDIDVSPDGTELITSYAGMENGRLVNNVVFRNFGSVGQNADARRIVGGFKDEFEGHLAGRVHFSTDEYSQAFYDGGIVFFSTKVLNTPEVLKNVTIEEKMLAIGTAEDFSAVLTEGTDGSAEYKLIFFNNKGEKKGEADPDISYKSMCVNAGTVIVYGSNDIRIYNRRGALKGSFAFNEGDISGISSAGKNNSFYVSSGNSVYLVKF